MTLSDRIADVRRKALAWRDIEFADRLYWRVWDEWRDIGPDLIIQMADRIEELEKAERKSDAMQQLAYANGMKAGWNMAEAGESTKFTERVASLVQEAVAELRAIKNEEQK